MHLGVGLRAHNVRYGSKANSLHRSFLCRPLPPESGHSQRLGGREDFMSKRPTRSVPRAHGAFPDTLRKFPVLSRKFPVLLLREFRRKHLIYCAENRA